ncbi:MAG: type III-A CRISPR-associated protein Cas10/Csm1 [Candidatus Micrarchaeota archaeon]|nr:type III-A CRISPR-associated protein Cas10/Csm1 [Candidatus Micrarchaeota archaeon]
MVMKEEEILVWAAFLHDLGKFRQRLEPASKMKTHSEHGSEEINTILVYPEKEKIEQLIKNHHKSEQYKDDRLLQILCLADWIAASERDRLEEKNHETQIEEGKEFMGDSLAASLLINPLSQDFDQEVGLKNLSYFTLSDISKASVIRGENLNTQSNQFQYQLLWKNFKTEAQAVELQKVAVPSLSFSILFYLFKKYAWCIPSATAYSGSKPDISLLDHSQLTAVYSLALYKTGWTALEAFKVLEDLKENYGENVEPSKFKEKELIDERKPFLLVAGDISGIQNYVYWSGKGTKSQYRAKQLRGRSFLLRLIEDSVAQKIIYELGLPQICILQKGGGRILLLVPNTAENRNSLKELIGQINKKIFMQYSGRLRLNLALVEATILDLMIRYQELSKKIEKELEIVKNELAKYIFSDQEYRDKLLKEYSGTEKCEQCEQPMKKVYDIGKMEVTDIGKKQVTNKGDEIKGCYNCFIEYEIGYNLHLIYQNKNANSYYRIIKSEIVKEMDVEKFFEPIVGLGVYYSFRDLNEITNEMEIKKEDRITKIYVNTPTALAKEGLGQIKEIELEMVGNYWGEKEFDVMASKNSAKYLGWLKMDADNLGNYFEKIKNLSTYCFSSRAVEIFFCSKLNNILEQYSGSDFVKSDTSAEKQEGYPGYIVYSGGDDLFLVGSWNHTLEIAQKISDEYGIYTASRRTLSAGFTVTDSSYPIQSASWIVDKEEKLAKEYKNSIGMFDQPLRLSKESQIREEQQKSKELPTLEQIMKKVEQIEENLPKEEETKKGTSLIRNIYDLIEEYEVIKNLDRKRKEQYRPFIFNLLIKEYNLKKNREQELRKFDSFKEALFNLEEKYISYAKVPLILYILKYRENKSEEKR